MQVFPQIRGSKSTLDLKHSLHILHSLQYDRGFFEKSYRICFAAFVKGKIVEHFVNVSTKV